MWFAVVHSDDHRKDGHVERPDRLLAAYQGLKDAAAECHIKLKAPTDIDNTIVDVNTGTLSWEVVQKVHHYRSKLEELAATSTLSNPITVADEGDIDGVTYVSGPASIQGALQAAGAAVAVTASVIQTSKLQNLKTDKSKQKLENKTKQCGLCLVRPPGHHATSTTPLGFCLLNNLAIAVEYYKQHNPGKKVMILDFDVHHGNGTAEIFRDDPNVLFIDIHEESAVYSSPPHVATDMNETGGHKNAINIPLPKHSGQSCVLAVLEGIIEPAATVFQPNIIFASAGLDAHWRDPFGLLQYQSSTYWHFGNFLRKLSLKLCNGQLVAVLEGGYDEKGIEEAVYQLSCGLGGKRMGGKGRGDKRLHPEPLVQVQGLVKQIQKIHGIEIDTKGCKMM